MHQPVTDQIDAVRALGASPVRNLVVPRLVAILVMLPVLTIASHMRLWIMSMTTCLRPALISEPARQTMMPQSGLRTIRSRISAARAKSPRQLLRILL